MFWLRLTGPGPASVEKTYTLHKTVSDLDHIDTDYLESIAPSVVITNACALLSGALIDRLHSFGCEIINVHNGINPRYRGTGNIWAAYERNFKMTGVTLHHIDAGIDTGETIATRYIDFIAQETCFRQIDVVAFEEGARMAVEYVLEGSVTGTKGVAARSRAYTFPRQGQYIAAKARYSAALSADAVCQTSEVWQKSFKDLASEEDKDVYQRQHWGDSGTIASRDQLVRQIVDECGPGPKILDIGCGDGRYRSFWTGSDYWGCDFSLETMSLGGKLVPSSTHLQCPVRPGAEVLSDGDGNHFVEAAVDAMPIGDAQMSTVLCVGLFQHLDNTGEAADEILRVLAPGGQLIVNTLRQPSWFELFPLRLLGLMKRDLGALVSAISRQDYFCNIEIAGTKLARRYSVAELSLLFAPQAVVKAVHYGGLGRTRFLSREITIVFEKKHR